MALGATWTVWTLCHGIQDHWLLAPTSGSSEFSFITYQMELFPLNSGYCVELTSLSDPTFSFGTFPFGETRCSLLSSHLGQDDLGLLWQIFLILTFGWMGAWLPFFPFRRLLGSYAQIFIPFLNLYKPRSLCNRFFLSLLYTIFQIQDMPQFLYLCEGCSSNMTFNVHF